MVEKGLITRSIGKLDRVASLSRELRHSLSSGELVSWRRLSVAGTNTLSDRRLLWALVGILAVARVLADLPVFMPAGADVYGFIDIGHRVLSNPGAIYPDAGAQIAQGFVFVTLYPPTQLLIAAAYALLPGSAGAIAWVATDFVAAIAALAILLRKIARFHPAAPPAFCLVAICFTPLFEDIRLGQRGGVLMLFGVAAMALVVSRPITSGILAGLATALKFYPGAMVLGVHPKRQWTFVASLLITTAAAIGVSFIPFGSPLFYLMKILLPSLTWQNSGPHDCFQNSTQLLYARVLNGEPYGVINRDGVWHQVAFDSLHIPLLATTLGYLTIVVVTVATIWAVWRSGAAQPYSLALCFSLGTLIPGEVFTYQFLPMLPILLIVFMRSLQLRRFGTALALSATLWILIASPCALPLPSLWTIAALAIFGLSASRAALFRPEVDSSDHA